MKMWLPWRKSQEFAPLSYEDATIENFVDAATADGAGWNEPLFSRNLTDGESDSEPSS